jgi:hypothetical protein
MKLQQEGLADTFTWIGEEQDLAPFDRGQPQKRHTRPAYRSVDRSLSPRELLGLDSPQERGPP